MDTAQSERRRKVTHHGHRRSGRLSVIVGASERGHLFEISDTSWRPNLSPGAGPRGATPRTTASTQGDRALGFGSDTRKCD